MKITQALKTAAAALVGYQTTGQGFTKVHHALTYVEACQWAHCYPAATITRHGRFIASTTTN